MSGMATNPSDPPSPSGDADPAPAAPAKPRRARSSASGSAAPRARTTKPKAAPAAPAYVDRGDAWCVVGAGPHGMSALKALLQNGIEADGYRARVRRRGQLELRRGEQPRLRVDAPDLEQAVHAVPGLPDARLLPRLPEPPSGEGVLRPLRRPLRPASRDPLRHRRRARRTRRRRPRVGRDRPRPRLGAGDDLPLRRPRRGQRAQLVAEDADLPGPGDLPRRDPALGRLQGCRRAARQARARRRCRQHRLRRRGRGRAERDPRLALDAARLLLQPQVHDRAPQRPGGRQPARAAPAPAACAACCSRRRWRSRSAT